MRFLLTFTLIFGLHCTHAQTAIQTKPQQLTVAKPESVGMSSERFKTIEQFLQSEVDQKHLPGGMLIVARKGKIVYHNAVGYHDLEAKKPLQKDQIFRIMSMSKALTTTAVMMLYEEGKIDLDDPASKYIPEFANTKVLVYYNEKDSTYSAVPAKKQVTIRHLLSHTAGIPYSHPLYYKAGIPDFFSTKPITIGQTMPKLAALPLMHEPGEKFTYGLNTDMLGYLVERVSGMRFGDFLQKRIFDPLGMNDTGFYVKKATNRASCCNIPLIRRDCARTPTAKKKFIRFRARVRTNRAGRASLPPCSITPNFCKCSSTVARTTTNKS